MILEPTGANTTVTGAIRQAARMTGTDFQYLLATAQVESNLNPEARAPTSSARGLFQFTEQTWLGTIKEQGTPLGYGPYANAIVKQPSGEYAVADPRMSGTVLNLRFDSTANALMGAAYTKANAGKLEARLGRDPTGGELYIAHFLGASGASRFISLADAQPNAPAAAIFPSAARANPTIFYDGRGGARSIGDVYRVLTTRFAAARDAQAATASAAPITREAPAETVASRKPAPDTATLTATYAAAMDVTRQRAAAMEPVFHGLFRSGGGSEPISPMVNSLWSTPPGGDAPTSPTAKAEPTTRAKPKPMEAAPVVTPVITPAAEANSDLGLFQDRAPDARALFRGRV